MKHCTTVDVEGTKLGDTWGRHNALLFVRMSEVLVWFERTDRFRDWQPYCMCRLLNMQSGIY